MDETLRVTGMGSAHCARIVERAVLQLPDVREARVDLGRATLSYRGAASRGDVVAAIRDAGYDVEEAP
jgi:copper chaperone CopZ